MITLRRSKIWLSFVLMIAVLGHFGLGHRDISAFVLCFGVDGHVAVERVAQEQLANENKTIQSNDETNVYTSNGDNPCPSPCTDIPIDGDNHVHLLVTDLLKFTIDIGLLPVFFLFSLLAFHARSFVRQPAFFDLPFTDPRLLALRSIVLLI